VHYGIQGRSTVLVWLRRFGNFRLEKTKIYILSNSKETPAQRIKRLEKELSDEKLKNQVLNIMIDISDKQYGTQIRKSIPPNSLQTPPTRIKYIQVMIVWDQSSSCL